MADPDQTSQDDSVAATSATGISAKRWYVLLVCAVVSLAAYWAVVRVAPGLAETEPSHVDGVLPWVKAAAPRADAGGEEAGLWAAKLKYIGLLAVLFAAYGAALYAVAGRSSRRVEATIFCGGIVLLVLLAASPVTFSTDYCGYAEVGRTFLLHHQDPTVDLSSLPSDDPYVRTVGNRYKSLPYGPVWTLVSSGVAWLAGERVGVAMLAFRALAILSVAATALLLRGCLRRLDPPRAALGMLLFLWNPLVVLESAISGHNDAFLMALCVAGIALHLRKRPALAMFCLMLSALVKYSTAPLLPLYLLMGLRECRERGDWRRRGRFLVSALGGGAVAAALVLGAVQAGLRGGPSVLAPRQWLASKLSGVFAQGYTNSVQELLYRGLRRGMGDEPADVRTTDFVGWWVKPAEATDFRGGADEHAPLLGRLAAETPLLVVAGREEGWLRVVDPATRRKGYVLEEATTVCDRPAWAEADPVWRRWEAGRGPAAVRADRVLKIVRWTLFGTAWLWAAWYASNLSRFLAAAAALTLASYWLVSSWFFPWYVTWALSLAAFRPRRAAAWVAAILSATALTLYATIGFDRTGETDWIFVYRSLWVFVPPTLAAVVFLVVARRGRAGPAAKTASGVDRPVPGDGPPLPT